MNSYLSSIIKQFYYYKSLGDKTITQINFEELQKEFAADSNSISIIIKHLVGNMLSRWTNFLTEDGEKEWKSLSIPKGQSKNYNKEKFSKEKVRRHFTDDL